MIYSIVLVSNVLQIDSVLYINIFSYSFPLCFIIGYCTSPDVQLYHQMVNTDIRLIIFFAAKDGQALYSQQKQDRELTVAQTMNSLLPNSDLN